MSLERIPVWLRYLLAILAFWALMLFLPYVLQLVDGFWMKVMGSSQTAKFIYALMIQGMAAVASCWASAYLAPMRSMITLVNASIAGILVTILILLEITSLCQWYVIVSHLITIGCLIGSCVFIRRHQQESKEEEFHIVG